MNDNDFEMIDALVCESPGKDQLVNQMSSEMATLDVADDDDGSFSMISSVVPVEGSRGNHNHNDDHCPQKFEKDMSTDGGGDEKSFASWSHINSMVSGIRVNNTGVPSAGSKIILQDTVSLDDTNAVCPMVGHGCSDESSVVSELTTNLIAVEKDSEPKPLACPKCYLISSGNDMVRCRACGGSIVDKILEQVRMELLPCPHCTFCNPDHAAICGCCGGSVQSVVTTPTSSPDEELALQLQMQESDPYSEDDTQLAQMLQLQEMDTRGCPQCTFLNRATSKLCECCGADLYCHSDELFMDSSLVDVPMTRTEWFMESLVGFVFEVHRGGSKVQACSGTAYQNFLEGFLQQYADKARLDGRTNLVLVYHFGGRDIVTMQKEGLHPSAIVSRNLEAAYTNPGLDRPTTTRRQQQKFSATLKPIDEDDSALPKGHRGWIVATLESPEGSPDGRAVHVSSLSATVYRIPREQRALPLVYFDPGLRNDDVIRKLLNGLYRICSGALNNKRNQCWMAT